MQRKDTMAPTENESGKGKPRTETPLPFPGLIRQQPADASGVAEGNLEQDVKSSEGAGLPMNFEDIVPQMPFGD